MVTPSSTHPAGAVIAAAAPSPRDQRVARRLAELFANDPQFKQAAPLKDVRAAIDHPGVRLAQIVAMVMEGYADRPALGQRARELVTDPATGRTSSRLLPRFDTLSYREVGARVGALASAWHHGATYAAALRAGDRVCVMGFTGADYAVIDLACITLGVVCVPMQTHGAVAQLVQVVAETEPRCFATSLDCLDAAVETVLAGARPSALMVFDYEARDDDQRDRFDAACRRLADADIAIPIESLAAVCERASKLPPAPLYLPAAGEDPMVTIFYTSGSTGSPKGAIYTERMFRTPWVREAAHPLICLNYMPMNHSFGRSWLGMILGNGGLCCFTARSDLSTLFEDIALVRPTMSNLVPRIAEMLFHQYQSALERHPASAVDSTAAASAVMADMRRNFLGGRVLSSTTGAAPLIGELRTFIEDCLDVNLNEGYGTTETGAISFNGRIMRPPIIDYKLVDVPELGYFSTDQPHPRGELLVKTHAIMPGYYKNPQATASVFDSDGYYRTGDIMAEVGPEHIVYVDRRNNVLKLAQGEFVAIAKLEAVFSSGHPAIHQIYVHGSSERAYLLAVVVPHPQAVQALGEGATAAMVKAMLREALQSAAKDAALNSYEVPRDFLVESEPFSAENGLLTSVGKFRRPGLKERYGARLDALYTDLARGQADELLALRRSGTERPLLETLARAVKATLGIDDVDLGSDASFEELGGDSLSALSFSMLIEEIFGIELPVGVVIGPTSSLQRLADYVESERSGASKRPTFAAVHGRGQTVVRASELTLDKFIDVRTLAAAPSLPRATGPVKTVLLTGANGFLGRFLCLDWLERLARVDGRLICIARGDDAATARRRILEVFDSGDAALLQHVETLAARHLEVLAGDLGEPRLGLDEATWSRLASQVDLIVHPAALVNHRLPYSQLFGPNVVGTAELIRLALTTRMKPFNNVSTVAAAILPDGSRMDEDADVRVASPERAVDGGYAGGYAASKWAGEVLLREAHDLCGLPVAVFRSDMILAHSRYAGQLNVPDMFTRLIFSLVATGIAPASFYAMDTAGQRPRAHYDGLPVDFTAEAIGALGSRAVEGFRTYHVLNPHDDGVSLDSFVDWLIAAGHPIRRIDDHAEWVERFETALRALPEGQRQQSSLALLDALRRPAPATRGANISADRFIDGVREMTLGDAGRIPHLSAALIDKYVADLRRIGLV